MTYEYQCRVQILIVPLDKFLIILLGLLTAVCIELSTNILPRGFLVLLLPVKGSRYNNRRDAGGNPRVYRLFVHLSIAIHFQIAPIPAAVGWIRRIWHLRL